MPLMEHIRELRGRVVKALIAIALGTIAGWLLYPHIWSFIEHPYCRLHFREQLVLGHGCHLYVNGVFDLFFLRLKVAFVAGLVMSSPLWFYQLWAFIAPGLYAREKRWTWAFVGTAVPLFVLGGGFAYYAMTKGLHFLLGMAPSGVIPLITINTYISYALAMLLIFGVAFELPLVVVILNLAGILTHQWVRKWRRMMIFLVFAFAAVFTPSPDPISMLLLAVPCVVLVELAEVFVWANDRRRARRPYPGLSADEQAVLDAGDSLGADRVTH
jgi:sec-independent protein translocase protein TatC